MTECAHFWIHDGQHLKRCTKCGEEEVTSDSGSRALLILTAWKAMRVTLTVIVGAAVVCLMWWAWTGGK
jgi:hypothetical protein